MTASNILPDAGRSPGPVVPFRFLLGLCVVGAGLAAAKPPSRPPHSCTEWDASRGYPGGRIYGITQTRDGYLWIGTDRGLVRFDGWTFRVFRQTKGGHSPIDSVFSLAGDVHGNLLISTPILQRLRLRNGDVEELPSLPGQPADALSGMYPQHNGTILIATVRHGVVAYDGDATFTTLPRTQSDSTAIARALDGTIWTGTATQGLFAYPGRPSPEKSKNLAGTKISALLPSGEHGLVVGSEKGLLHWEGSGQPGRVFGPPGIRAMWHDRRSNLWIGAEQGLYFLGPDQPATPIPACSPAMVTSLFEDREGDVWAGTANGIIRVRQQLLATYRVSGDTEASSGPVLADGQGNVWSAPSGQGLVRISEGRFDRILPAGDFLSLGGDGRDLWLGRRDGSLWRMSPADKGIGPSRTQQGLPGSPLLALLKSRDGTLWVARQNAGVAEIASGRTTVHSDGGGIAFDTVSAIEQGPDGALWFAASGGVASLVEGEWRGYTARDGLPPGRVNCLFADGAGGVWVGADQGLAYIEKGRARELASSLPLLHEPILGISLDREDYLWVVTSTHIFRARRSELLNAKDEPIFVRQFGAGDGLPATAPSRTSRSIVTDAAGRVWISLGNVLVMADPAAFLEPSPATLVEFQQISADELSLPLSETVTVPSDRLRTVIRFAGLNLAAPERVRFRYRLNGFDRAWSDATSEREATYTNLPPGPYHFEVQASNIDGLWNGRTSAINLSIEPAYWQTLWFRCVIVLALCAMGVMADQLRLRAMERQWNLRFQERLDERNRIARELHDTLLQSFQGLILRFQAVRDMLPDEPAAAGDALGSAIDRATEAVTEGRDAIQALRGEQDELDELGESLSAVDREFRVEAGENDAHAAYRVLVEGTPRRLHPVVRDDLYRIAREAVRNALRHGRAQQVELDIRYDDAELRLRVRDDGCGIDSQVLRSGGRKGHYGLPGMRERATSIGGEFEIWSELRRGTEIEVKIPGSIAYRRPADSSEARILA